MLVSDIVRRVQWAAGDSTGTLIDTTNCVDLINDAQTELNVESKLFKSTVAFSTVQGSDQVFVAADLISIVSVSLDNWGFLQPVTKNDIVQLSDNTSTGQPRYYAPNAGFFNVFPTADAIYTGQLTYVKIPTFVTGAGDTPAMPAYLHPLIVRLCLAAVKEKDEDFEAAEAIRARALVEASIMIAKARNGQEQSYNSVRGIDYPFREEGYLV